jgi:flagellar export protein FliJ
MQRFTSPLLKVHGLCEQKCKLAEIELARALGHQRTVEERVRSLGIELDSARTAAAQALSHPMQTSTLHGIYNHVALIGEHLAEMQKQLLEAEKLTEQARDLYRNANVQIDALSRLLENERAGHRKLMFRDQQIQMDDGAIFRWQGPETMEMEFIKHG